MQLFALDGSGRVVLADQARRQKNYYCRECRQAVRLRHGPHKRAHFFHIEPLRICSQHGKTLEHLLVQTKIKEILGESCALERRFDQIGRIADVCWEKEKIIFEVQCSAISVREIQARGADYQALGYRVVWILHDNYYGQPSLRSAEAYLHGRHCYFTNMDKQGEGGIYDRCSWVFQGKRVFIGPRLPVDIASPVPIPLLTGNLPYVIKARLKLTTTCFGGDLFHADPGLFEEALHLEKRQQKQFWILQMQQHWRYYVLRPYEAVLRCLLEKYCSNSR